MSRGKKTSPEVVYQIMTSWAITGNYAETAKELKISETTVRKIVKENKDKEEYAELCKEKRKSFSDKAEAIIDKALERLARELDDEEKEIPVNHLTTVIGTMYDKKALADGKATDNVSVSIKLPEGIDEYAG